MKTGRPDHIRPCCTSVTAVSVTMGEVSRVAPTPSMVSGTGHIRISSEHEEPRRGYLSLL